MGVPVVIGGDNLPSPVGIGLTDLPNIGEGAVAPPGPPVPASLRYLQAVLFKENLESYTHFLYFWEERELVAK